jgi:hypothetical protein
MLKNMRKTAFLYGRLEEEVYMYQPEGYAVRGRENDVCRLIKSIYGLKQAPRVWNMELNDAIIKYGLPRSQHDQCLYFRLQGEEWMVAVFFVGDAMVCGTNRKALEDFVSYLEKKFELRTLPAGRFLGLTIKRDRSRRMLSLSQLDFINDLVAKFKMESCHPNVIPAEPGLQLSRAMAPTTKEEEASMKEIPYQSAVGALLYLSTTTRPDIAYAVSKVARFNQNPGVQHWIAVKRIIRYLAGTKEYGIHFSPTNEKGVHGFTDADYGGDSDGRKSTSGCIFLLHGGPISWFSRKQECTATSTTESEFVAGSEAAKEGTWIKSLLEEIGQGIAGPIPLFCDNQGAIKVAYNQEMHRKMKHIAIRYRYIQEAQNNGVISTNYVSSQEQLADAFTKPLAAPRFKYLRDKIGVRGVGEV